MQRPRKKSWFKSSSRVSGHLDLDLGKICKFPAGSVDQGQRIRRCLHHTLYIKPSTESGARPATNSSCRNASIRYVRVSVIPAQYDAANGSISLEFFCCIDNRAKHLHIECIFLCNIRPSRLCDYTLLYTNVSPHFFWPVQCNNGNRASILNALYCYTLFA